MTFFAFSNPRAVLAAVSLFVLLSAAAVGNDLEPLEDVTKLEKPTISYTADGGVYLIDFDGQNNRLWLKGEYGLPKWSRDGKRVSVAGGVPDKFYGSYVLNLRTGEETNMDKRIIQRMGINFWREFEILSSQWMPGGWQRVCVVGDFFVPPTGPPRPTPCWTPSDTAASGRCPTSPATPPTLSANSRPRTPVRSRKAPS